MRFTYEYECMDMDSVRQSTVYRIVLRTAAVNENSLVLISYFRISCLLCARAVVEGKARNQKNKNVETQNATSWSCVFLFEVVTDS